MGSNYMSIFTCYVQVLNSVTEKVFVSFTEIKDGHKNAIRPNRLDNRVQHYRKRVTRLQFFLLLNN